MAPKEAPQHPKARGAVVLPFCPVGLRERAGRGPEDPGMAPKEAPQHPKARGAVALPFCPGGLRERAGKGPEDPFFKHLFSKQN